MLEVRMIKSLILIQFFGVHTDPEQTEKSIGLMSIVILWYYRISGGPTNPL